MKRMSEIRRALTKPSNWRLTVAKCADRLQRRLNCELSETTRQRLEDEFMGRDRLKSRERFLRAYGFHLEARGGVLWLARGEKGFPA